MARVVHPTRAFFRRVTKLVSVHAAANGTERGGCSNLRSAIRRRAKSVPCRSGLDPGGELTNTVTPTLPKFCERLTLACDTVLFAAAYVSMVPGLVIVPQPHSLT